MYSSKPFIFGIYSNDYLVCAACFHVLTLGKDPHLKVELWIHLQMSLFVDINYGLKPSGRAPDFFLQFNFHYDVGEVNCTTVLARSRRLDTLRQSVHDLKLEFLERTLEQAIIMM